MYHPVGQSVYSVTTTTMKHAVTYVVLVLVCLSGWSYVSRGIVEARALHDAACAAHETPHGTCTQHDRRHIEDLETYCLETERRCDKLLLVATLGRVASLVLMDTVGVETRAQFGLWSIMVLSSPATWSVLIGIAALCVIASYARAWTGQGKAVVGAVVKRIGGGGNNDVALPVAAPVVMFPAAEMGRKIKGGGAGGGSSLLGEKSKQH